MKKVYLLTMMLLCSVVAFSQVKKVAILDIVDKEGKVSYAQKLMLRSSLAKAVASTAGYEAYDRTDIDAIVGEHNFQRTGMVNEDQIRQLGEMTGAAYILVVEAVEIAAKSAKEDPQLFVTAKILDVETARTERTDYTTMGTSPDALLAGCTQMAANLLKVEEKLATPVVETKEPTKKEKVKTSKYSFDAIDNSPRISYSGNNIYLDDKKLTNEDYQRFLRALKPIDQVQYQKARSLTAAGWSIFGVGVGGLTTCFWGIGVGDGFLVILGAAIAPTLLITSIPMVCVGHTRINRMKKHALDVYLQKNPTPITYNITAGQNGIGLAINF